MPFPTVCPGCGSAYQLADHMQGKKVVCKKCQEAFVAQPKSQAIRPAKTAPREAAKPAAVAAARDKPSGRDKPKQPAPKSNALPWIIGGVAAGLVGLFCLTALGVGAWFFLDRSKSKAPEAVVASAAPTSPTPAAPRETESGPAKKKEEPPEKGGEPKKAGPGPVAPGGQLSRQALANLKGATVFIKVDAGKLSCTGSGFLCKIDGDTGYVITNHHVVNPEAEMLQPVRVRRGRTTTYDMRVVKYKAQNARISAVFHSGTKAELVVKGEVLATDDSRDLAVLRVKGLRDWPRPISLDEKAELVETMPVYILGFPFGGALTLTKGNPAVTINKGSVSSLRQDEFGQMKAVQIDGAINPGNSGGPVVDADGRLLGVSVATIRGSGIGLAIAPDELTRMFQGRVGGVAMKEKKIDAAVAEYDVNMHLIDPMGRIKSASLLYKVAATPALRLTQKADGAFDPLEGAQRVDLKIGDQKATGSLTMGRKGASDRFLIFQARYVNGSGKTLHTQLISKAIRPAAVAPPPVVVGKPPEPAPGGGGLGGGATTVGDVTFQEVTVSAAQIARHILWAPDGKSFYVLEKNTGTLRKIALDGLKEASKLELKTPCNWMTMSAEGIVVAANTTQEVYVVGTAALTVKRKMSAPKVVAVASAPGLSVAFASTQGRFPGEEALSVLDLKKGAIVRQYTGRDLTKKFIGFGEPTATPDGKYLFTRGGLEQLHRFKIAGATLTYEESSVRIAQNGQAIEVSPDSKWVALPSGGGNYDAAKPYSTFVYSVTNLSRPALTVEGGAYPRAMGFDPKLGYVYTCNFTSQLIVFTTKGLKLKELALPGAGDVRQFVTHRDGGRLLVLTANKLFYVVLKKS